MEDLNIDGGVILIRIDVKCDDFEWIHLNQGRVLVVCCEHSIEPLCCMKGKSIS
jgi:hypothetical protein